MFVTGRADVDTLPSAAAALVRLARMKAGLTQQALAEPTGVARSMISAYERDLRQPTLATLLRVLRAAGFDLRLNLEPYVWADDAERQGQESDGGGTAASAAHEAQWARWHDVASKSGTG